MKNSLILGSVLGLLGGLFFVLTPASAASLYDNTANPSLGAPCVLCNFPPHEYQAGFSVVVPNPYFIDTATFYMGATATAYQVTSTWTSSAPGATTYYATATVPAGTIAPVTFAHWFFWTPTTGPAEYQPPGNDGTLWLPGVTNTVRFFQGASLAVGDYVEGTQVSVSSTDVIKSFETYDGNIVADSSPQRAPKLILNGVSAPLPPLTATPGLDPFNAAFLNAYGLRSTSSIAELQAAHANATSSCPDLFLLHGACEFAAWLLVPDMTDLGELVSSTYAVAATRLPLNYVLGMWSAMEGATQVTSSTSVKFSLPLPASSTAALYLPTTTSAFSIDVSSTLVMYTNDEVRRAFRSALSLVIYVTFFTGCYATTKRIFA